MAGRPRLYPYTAGFLRRDVRRILEASGWALALGLPGPEDRVAVWGRGGRAWRGEAVARRTGAGIVRVEDAFLRSVHPGRDRRARGPLGLLIDPVGLHYDASAPSLIETLALEAVHEPALIERAQDGIARLVALDLSKYNIHHEAPPAPGYVLVVDQVRGDASAPDPGLFAAMLAAARRAHPDARIVIKAHPETQAGLRAGHFGRAQCDARTEICAGAVSPWRLLEGAIAVYTVSSQLGYEAILAGHRPHVFGTPFYAGWGLSTDAVPVPRRLPRSAAQLFAASHLLAPSWYDPCRARACSFEDAVDQLEAEVRAWRQDRAGHVASGMRLWKRRHLQRFFGTERPVRFVEPPSRAARVAARSGCGHMVWGGAGEALHVEDGFLRSRGLGAALVPPLSLVVDGLGIYYDPTRPSEMERLIAAPLPPGGRARAQRLIAAIRAGRLSKYNLGGAAPELPLGHRILVPGQVEDDASLRLGGGEICTNLSLLRLVRAKNPEAIVFFKPHPDVAAGLRPGAVPRGEALRHADAVLDGADPAALLDAVDEVWTMTSLLGFEALLRGIPVTVTGAPFYAGWGLTRDLGAVPARRRARPDLLHLAHAVLIAYPRYLDPLSGRACPPEVVVERLIRGGLPRENRVLARLQGLLASRAHLWR